MTIAKQRAAIVDAMRGLDSLGLNRGSSGNISVSISDGFLITPTGRQPGELKPADIVRMASSGECRGRLRPSSEWLFHRDIYARRGDAGAVVHAHSPHATALACLRRDIPAFHYMVAVAGGSSIRCADYATFGTQALSDAALRALEGRRACLLANHGQIAIGRTLADAVRLAVEVESLAEQFLKALQVGEPVILDEAEMTRVLEKFRTYGAAIEVEDAP